MYFPRETKIITTYVIISRCEKYGKITEYGVKEVTNVSCSTTS
jgi:hypothetical protein